MQFILIQISRCTKLFGNPCSQVGLHSWKHFKVFCLRSLSISNLFAESQHKIPRICLQTPSFLQCTSLVFLCYPFFTRHYNIHREWRI